MRGRLSALCMNASPAFDADAALLDDPLAQAGHTLHAGGVAESALQLAGLHCAACADIIECALGRVDGVLSARVSAAAARAQVRWDPTRTRLSALVAAIQGAGYGARPDSAADARALRRAEARSALWRVFVALFCMMQVMMLATPAYVAGAGELTPDMKRLLDWAQWVLSLPVMVFSAAPLFGGAWRSLRARRIGMDVPVAIGLLVTFVASTAAAFAPDGAFGGEVYFDSLTMFVAFLLGARWLEMRARHRAAAVLEDAFGTLPTRAWRLLDGGQTELVNAHRLRVGDRLRVPLGEAFPADGWLLDGETSVDEALLSGESLPLAKRPGDALVGGSINCGAPVTMQVARVGADTRAAAIAALVRDAASQRPALAATADRYAGPFLWTVLALAALAAAVWSVIDPSRALWVAVSVLIVTCPCALSLAAPTAMLSAAGRLARDGVLLRRLDALEPMARVDRVFLDKTGTLTLAERRLRATSMPARVWLPVAASLAAWSAHPQARSLAAAAQPADMAWREVQEFAGRGLQARDDVGHTWRLGSAAWAGAGEADDATWLARDSVPMARYVFDEQPREDAVQALDALRAQSVAVEVLSGDAQARVDALVAPWRLDGARGDAAPQDKLAAVRAAQARGECVAMVGDGVNDAPVLAQADVSFAMGEGALAARHGADAVMLSMRLADVPAAFALARRTLRIVRQNLAWALVYNAACIPLALAGWLPPWAAGLGMATSSLVVVANSLRLAR
jgi:Cu2+-exporting ATPase